MSEPKTLLDLAGASLPQATLSNATLVMIDLQNEYADGPLKLHNVETAVSHAATLLERARAAGTPIIHIAHVGGQGGAFDRTAQRGQIMDAVAPEAGELVIEKRKPNALADTNLQEELEKIGRKDLILAGFMTHMCVSSTARAAFDLGYSNTIVEETTTTRALPKPGGGAVEASVLHESALAALADRFACILPNVTDIAD
ncbi:cysteine hydrolase family protein [Pelagibius sp. Alg239-R121]|uniref:cysteine hydrolase family protein n=1 Tax=Pelagibius sp. Alg239-R121 TaxID=2993448 RepID=UPI0024A68BB0|nr:cysteine hydrolase family protein [Pelagibius sp. Alg239-R121]